MNTARFAIAVALTVVTCAAAIASPPKEIASSSRDLYGLLMQEGRTDVGVTFFLRPGQTAADVLGPRHANATALSADCPSIAAGCEGRAAATRRSP